MEYMGSDGIIRDTDALETELAAMHKAANGWNQDIGALKAKNKRLLEILKHSTGNNAAWDRDRHKALKESE